MRNLALPTFSPIPPVSAYQNIELNPAASATSVSWSFKTITFKDVAGATDEQYFDITSMLPKRTNGADWTTSFKADESISSGQLVFQKITANGAYTERCQWTSKGAIVGWQTYPKSGTGVKIEPGDYVLKKGEGLIVTYAKTVGCNLQVSGEVELSDMSTAIPAAASATSVTWAFGGNFTPVKIDIRSVLPKRENGADWTTSFKADESISSGQLVFQKITANGAYTERCQWTSKGAIVGWQTYPKTGTGHVLAENEWTLDPGEGYIITYAKTVPCKLVFPTPIQEKAAE